MNWVDPLGLCNLKDFDPDYGFWGGNDWSGGKKIKEGEIGDAWVPAIDSLDFLYKKHDFETYNGNPNADKNLLRGIESLPKNPYDWESPPKDVFHAQYHKNLAYAYFWWSEYFKSLKMKRGSKCDK